MAELDPEIPEPSARGAAKWLPAFAAIALGGAIAALSRISVEVSPSTTQEMQRLLPAWTVLPFIALLLAIAVAPLATPRAWQSDRIKTAIVAVLAVPFAVYLAVRFGSAGTHQLLEKAREYIAFICLLGALFVISGGVYLQGSLSGTPAMNTVMLGIGAVLASAIGTTGASMVLIRPLLRANRSREEKSHLVVFFIFIVSNCGGLLTPLGDPPLFLGFLKGVPFAWPIVRLWPIWLFVNVVLLAVFHFWDDAVFEREERRRPGSQLEEVMKHEPLRVRGWRNLLLLFGVVAVIYTGGCGWGTDGECWPFGYQEAALLALAVISFLVTPRPIHEGNRFHFAPLAEVALLFAGIFATMIPALLLLNAHAASSGISRPWEFFWSAGLLSSFLDNAPTYLAFAAAAAGVHHVPVDGRYLAELLQQASGERLLVAVSAGAVLMGANTYIGNGPNFMVKAIADRAGVRTPTFHAYLGYSAAVLLPTFVAVTLLFLR